MSKSQKIEMYKLWINIVEGAKVPALTEKSLLVFDLQGKIERLK